MHAARRRERESGRERKVIHQRARRVVDRSVIMKIYVASRAAILRVFFFGGKSERAKSEGRRRNERMFMSSKIIYDHNI